MAGNVVTLDLSELTIEQLKALAFDFREQLDQTDANLCEVRMAIHNKLKEQAAKAEQEANKTIEQAKAAAGKTEKSASTGPALPKPPKD